jgi:hypothetical protein
VDELIASAGAVTARCDGCITNHNAIRAAASCEEIGEAPGTAIAVNAGAALVYSTRVMDAFRGENGLNGNRIYPALAGKSRPVSRPISIVINRTR